tara:strand:- start:33 stop:1073 length:1041 start_codon:yes stop_codon:yes gene_type:complete
MIDTSQNIFGNTFRNCLINASGCKCTNKEELDKLNSGESGGIVSKSCSLEQRNGNPSPRYYESDAISFHEHDGIMTINSMGLPNHGHKYYINLMGTFDKPYIISVAGNYLMDNFTILKEINTSFAAKILSETFKKDNYQMVEINVSCPNIEGKEQLAYNFNDLNQFLFRLDAVAEELPYLTIGLKLPPYFDPSHFLQLGEVISKHLDIVKFITTINSVGNTLVIDHETDSPVIQPKNGLGGLGGSYVKPVALANIWQLHLLFNSDNGICRKNGKPDMIIIGCGGIVCGRDVYEHILCGAHLCQIGSQLMKEGNNCFLRILKELNDEMQSRQYNSFDLFRGQLKLVN